MIDPRNPLRDEHLETYLDGALDAADRAAVEEALRSDPACRRQVHLQERIDAALMRMYRTKAPTNERVTEILTGGIHKGSLASRRIGRLGWVAAVLAAAAAIGWLVIANPFGRSRTDNRYFTARPLADLYREAVANGFEPGYQCEEAGRFADAFARRQGVSLKLLRLPVGVRMLGLSYLGGLSPETTAMLSLVDGHQVVVFVDRAAVDRADATTISGGKLRIFRQERDGLVFYEVTPLDRPRMIEFLAPLTAEGPSELPGLKSAA